MDKIGSYIPLKNFIKWWGIQSFLYFLGMIIIVGILFSMGNQLNQVETWIYWHNWEFLLWVKILGFYLFTYGDWGKYLKETSFRISPFFAFFVLSVSLTLVNLCGKVLQADQIRSLEGAVNIISKIIWYIVDILVLKEWLSLSSQKSVWRRIGGIAFWACFNFLGHFIFFSFSHSLDIYYLFNIFLGLFFILFQKISFGDLLALILFVFVPSHFFSASFKEPYGRWIEFESYLYFVEYLVVVMAFIGFYLLCEKFLLRASSKC